VPGVPKVSGVPTKYSRHSKALRINKAIGYNRITGRKLSYPLPTHEKNPEIHDFYLRGLIEKFSLPEDVFE